MKHKSPSPSLKSAVSTVLRAACGKPRFFVITPRQAAEHPRVLEGLEQLDPKHVSAIAADLGSTVDLALSFVGENRGEVSADRSKRLVARAARVAPAAPLLLSLARSGYIREAAVAALAPPGGAFSLALLLLRANDWVRQVRAAAAAKIHQFLDDTTIENRHKVEIIAGCIELIFDPERFGRTDEASSKALVRLRSFPGVEAMLQDVILTSRTDSAPRFLRACLRSSHFDDQLPELARRGRHPRVRQMALQGLLRGCHKWKQNRQLQRRDIEQSADLDGLAGDGLRDRAIDVQRVALSYVIRSPESTLHTESTLRPFLAHRAASLVDKAVFGLQSLGVDVIAECRERLRLGEPEISCVSILSRFGDPEDGRLIYEARARSASATSGAFIEAAAKLGHEPALDELRRLSLRTNDLSIAREASRALLRADAEIDFGALQSVLLSDEAFVERKLVPFAAKFSTVQMAHLAVLLSKRRADYDCSHLWKAIGKKRNRGAFRPAQSEVEALLSAVGGDRDLELKIHRLLGLGRPVSNVVRIG
jgi:hypothetical protein